MFTWLVLCSGQTVRFLGPTFTTIQSSTRCLWLIAYPWYDCTANLISGSMLTGHKVILMWCQRDVMQTTCHPTGLADFCSWDCSRVASGMSVWFDDSRWWPRDVFQSNVDSTVLYGICCPKFVFYETVVWLYYSSYYCLKEAVLFATVTIPVYWKRPTDWPVTVAEMSVTEQMVLSYVQH